MALRELSSLEKFLGLKKLNKYSTQGERKVPVLQNNNGPSLVGLATISSHLVHEAKKRELLGDSAEQRAVVQQWLEYRLTRLDNCSKDEVKIILKELNQYLVDKVYLAGNSITLADTLVYNGIHPIVMELAVQQKEEYLNVTRWFDHIQHYPGVRHHLPPVVVLRNRVYPSGYSVFSCSSFSL
ncbi:eukaryotic translation elongation factor 1 epsilon-1 isoform X1 [Neoarius graeffei]|uniref:eukaryotic translation elongation factor 1 epsilon-1 isoform X1 n=1 Tax=Neoarius graeffei TaxID=443677 RepID=UPI00298D122A|nr:eukaryotic translation elongation factor 1 epsilon-1 isoform X1 [Neoarius graeffei]